MFSVHIYPDKFEIDTLHRTHHCNAYTVIIKGEVHSRMAIYFLYANKKFIQRYVIHQNFGLQRLL